MNAFLLTLLLLLLLLLLVVVLVLWLLLLLDDDIEVSEETEDAKATGRATANRAGNLNPDATNNAASNTSTRNFIGRCYDGQGMKSEGDNLEKAQFGISRVICANSRSNQNFC
jgi:ABC-type oligopeptide transport system substrate-binding subunit